MSIIRSNPIVGQYIYDSAGQFCLYIFIIRQNKYCPPIFRGMFYYFLFLAVVGVYIQSFVHV